MKYLAYFQSFTHTHAEVERIYALYDEALSVEDVVGLVVLTRPDCISDRWLDYLQALRRRVPVIVELGVETMHDRTLRLVNRCHDHDCSLRAIGRLAKRGIIVCAHLILGLPGESDWDICQTVTAIGEQPVKLVKFHQLQVLCGTELARRVIAGQLAVREWTVREYAALCAQLSDLLPDDIVVERWAAEAPPEMLLSPRWGKKPSEIVKMIEHERVFQNVLSQCR